MKLEQLIWKGVRLPDGPVVMKVSKILLKAANTIINFIVVLSLCAAGLYAVYALWDNNRIYAAAEDVQADMKKLKPDADQDKASFEELLAINPDVCAWVSLDNTKVDYPVLQGANNMIYLDSRNDRTFSDRYSLLYGHHMKNGSMFGDLDLYKDEAFFTKNTTGMLILPDRSYKLEIFACLLIEAGDDYIFEPNQWQNDIDGLISYAEKNALHLHQDTVNELRKDSNLQVLALSTCSSEFTDARTIILAAMEPC